MTFIFRVRCSMAPNRVRLVSCRGSGAGRTTGRVECYFVSRARSTVVCEGGVATGPRAIPRIRCSAARRRTARRPARAVSVAVSRRGRRADASRRRRRSEAGTPAALWDCQRRVLVTDVRTGQKGLLRMNQPADHRGRRASWHRSVPHTADLCIEAWGPTRDIACRSLRGLVESFSEVSGTGYERLTALTLPLVPMPSARCRRREVIYAVDTDGEISATDEVSRAADDGIDLMLR